MDRYKLKAVLAAALITEACVVVVWLVLAFVICAMTPLQAQAKIKGGNEENVIYTFSKDCLIDSVLHAIQTGGARTVFVDMHAMAGSLCNRYIQGDKNVPSSSIDFCAFGAYHKIENIPAFEALIERLMVYNETSRVKVSLYGIDCSTGPSSWTVELNHVPAYKETTLSDSLERYCLDEDIDIYQQADRTAKMMEKNSRRFQKLLGEEYPIWLRYIKALRKRVSAQDYHRQLEEADQSILNDYLWLDKRVPGRKVVICSPVFMATLKHLSPEDVAADRVRDIYARVIANGRDSVEAGSLSYDSRMFDTRDYLSADYYQWYKKTEDYDNAKDNEGWRFFSYDHWGTLTEYNCIAKAKVARTEDLPDGRVLVRVELECASYNIGEKTPYYTAPEVVTLILVRDQPDGWYVDDFLDANGDSEKERMKQYLSSHQ